MPIEALFNILLEDMTNIIKRGKGEKNQGVRIRRDEADGVDKLSS